MNTDWYKNVNPKLDRLAQILGMGGSKPSHGYTIAEKAPEVVTAPGVYFPAEKGEVIPLESRQMGGLTDPSMSMADKLRWQRKTYGLQGGIGSKVLGDLMNLTPNPTPTSDSRFSTDLSASKGFAPTGEALWERKRKEFGPYGFGPTSKPEEELIPRQEGGKVAPSSSKDDKSRGLDILESIIEKINPSGMESKTMMGLNFPPESMKTELEKFKILSKAMDILKPPKPPGEQKSSSGRGSSESKTPSSKSPSPNTEANLPAPPTLPTVPTSMEGIPTPQSIQPEIRTDSPEINPMSENIVNLAPNDKDTRGMPMFSRQGGGGVWPPTPESLEIEERKKWAQPGYPEKRLAEARETLGPSISSVSPGYEKTYYEAHPEEAKAQEIYDMLRPPGPSSYEGGVERMRQGMFLDKAREGGPYTRRTEQERAARATGYMVLAGGMQKSREEQEAMAKKAATEAYEPIKTTKTPTPHYVPTIQGDTFGNFDVTTGTFTGIRKATKKDVEDIQTGEKFEITPYQQESLDLRKESSEQNRELRKEALEQNKIFHDENLALRTELKDINLSLKKRVPANLVKGLSEKTNSLDKYASLINEFEPNYSGKVIFGPTMTGIHERIGTDKNRVLWWKNLKALDIQMRHEMFGATLTANEQKAWDAVTINENSNPEIIKSALRNRLNIAKNALDREIQGYEEAGYEVGGKRNEPKSTTPGRIKVDPSKIKEGW